MSFFKESRFTVYTVTADDKFRMFADSLSFVL